MRKSTLSGITALLLAGALAGGVCATGYASRNGNGKWFANSDIKTWHWSDKTPAGDKKSDGDKLSDKDNILIDNNSSDNLAVACSYIEPEQYAANGISAQAETAYSLTATLTPADTVETGVYWSIVFANPSSAWASGKNISDYCTITPTASGALTANFECLQAFGEPIKVICSSSYTPSIKAECTFDYLAKVTGLSAIYNPSLPSGDIGRLYCGSSSNNTVQITPVYGTGTVYGEVTNAVNTFTLSNGFYEKINSFVSNVSSGSFYALKTVKADGLSFSLPLSKFYGYNVGDRAIVENKINNYFAQSGLTSSTGGYNSPVFSGYKIKITYSYGEFSQSFEKTFSEAIAIRPDGLTAIATVESIALKTNVVIW